MRILKLWLAALAIASTGLLGSSCGGGNGVDACGVEAQKQFVLDTTNDWYLFLNLLPASIDPNAYGTAQDLLDALTANARAQGFDRHFSFLTTSEAEQQFFGDGQAVAFGLGTELRPINNSDHLYITRVEKGDPDHTGPDGNVIAPSPAANAGFQRGDEILAIGPDPDHMVDVQTLEQQGALTAAFGPPQEGVTRSFRVEPVTGGSPVVRTMTKALITLDPVPLAETIVSAQQIGYLSLDSFITPAEQQLRDGFAQFQQQGIHDVIIDLRYNGGGLIEVAQLLANLLAGQEVGRPMFSYQFNSRHTDQNQTKYFSGEPQAIAPDRIAFITTDATASASELTINVLDPYANIAIVGSPTFGKPVGQSGFDMGPPCDTVLRLITFKTINAAGHTDYFNGLPDSQFQGDFCAADDDLTHARGDVSETSTATAISWIDNGACPASGKSLAKAQFLRSEHPTLVEDNQPGSF